MNISGWRSDSDYMNPASPVRMSNMQYEKQVGVGRVAEPEGEAGLFTGSSPQAPRERLGRGAS